MTKDPLATYRPGGGRKIFVVNQSEERFEILRVGVIRQKEKYCNYSDILGPFQCFVFSKRSNSRGVEKSQGARK